ncbi:MAG: Fis family transcriptional regulator [Cycloclasticus sp. symbiont of Poecilosclerida sp. M]|nr:MAG: Fis family transcriptional regulator [Cycloclasticus sp. symbiont of Poecilosclerida sp. M]
MSSDTNNLPLCRQVKHAIEAYFEKLDGHEVNNLHAMVISQVEKPLIKSVLEHTQSNQSKAAKILGLSRGTLRKKIAEHQLEN